ncbi:MAG TPA: hypothetical protein VLA36_05465 [Longimicrobiales bacterium]|nr:hypothetical protein [Longimicrobiales bacterium]
MSFRRFGPGRIVPLLAAAAFAGCAGGPDPEAAGLSHMYVHYTQVGEIVEGVVDGDVPATRSGARWLANHRSQQFPAGAEGPLEMMRAEARIILAQDKVTDIAMSVGRMGGACARCHVALNGGPRINVEMAPPATSDPDRTMVRHVWAVDRLWEGIIGPSDAAWASGAAVLAAPGLDLGPPGNRPAQADDLAKRIPELGQMAKAARDPRERAEVYGHLLQTCAQCHEALGMRMR